MWVYLQGWSSVLGKSMAWMRQIVLLQPFFATSASLNQSFGQSQILRLEDYKADIGEINRTVKADIL
jgi:hypothetical protein